MKYSIPLCFESLFLDKSSFREIIKLTCFKGCDFYIKQLITKVSLTSSTIIRVVIFLCAKYSLYLWTDHPKFVESRRGRQLIQLGRYTFGMQRLSSCRAKTRWMCSTHNSRGCKAVIHTVDEEIVFVKNNHNH